MVYWGGTFREWGDIVIMITAEKIKVYDTFGGLDDGLALTGSDYQKQLFENSDDWYFIMNFYQDILLINNKLASLDYIKKAMDTIKERCDNEAYYILASRIMQS